MTRATKFECSRAVEQTRLAPPSGPPLGCQIDAVSLEAHTHFQALAGEAWDRVNGSSWHVHVWLFELAGLFVSSLQRKRNAASTIDSIGNALVAQAQYRPGSMGMARNRQLTTNKPRAGVTVLCPINELHGPVDLQSQLECIISTCM